MLTFIIFNTFFFLILQQNLSFDVVQWRWRPERILNMLMKHTAKVFTSNRTLFQKRCVFPSHFLSANVLIKTLPFNDEVSEEYFRIGEENVENAMRYLHSRTENYRNILQTHLVLWFLQNRIVNSMKLIEWMTWWAQVWQITCLGFCEWTVTIHTNAAWKQLKQNQFVGTNKISIT